MQKKKNLASASNCGAQYQGQVLPEEFPWPKTQECNEKKVLQYDNGMQGVQRSYKHKLFPIQWMQKQSHGVMSHGIPQFNVQYKCAC
jgi:hypothetical protein